MNPTFQSSNSFTSPCATEEPIPFEEQGDFLECHQDDGYLKDLFWLSLSLYLLLQ